MRQHRGGIDQEHGGEREKYRHQRASGHDLPGSNGQEIEMAEPATATLVGKPRSRRYQAGPDAAIHRVSNHDLGTAGKRPRRVGSRSEQSGKEQIEPDGHYDGKEKIEW